MDAPIHSETGWAYGVIYDDLSACGCGYFDARLELLRDTLRDCPLYNAADRSKYASPLAEWFLCLMDGAELIEHGVPIGGSWLTEKGERLLAVFNDEMAWDVLLNGNCGYCGCADCIPAPVAQATREG